MSTMNAEIATTNPPLRSVTGKLFGALRTYWTDAIPVERVMYRIGALMMVSGVLHVGVFAVLGGSWTGPVSFRKAVTFGLAFGLTVITLAWVTSFLTMSKRLRAIVLGLFTAACVVEVAGVTTQAWRRVPSHFNRSTPFDTAVTTLLAAGGGVIVFVVVLLTVVALRRQPTLSPSMKLALRIGFGSLTLAMAMGVVMIARGSALAFTDPVAAYDTAGSLKPAHAAPMHGILVLPLAAWLLAATSFSETKRLRIVQLAVASYAVLVAGVVVEAFVHVDPLAPDVIGGLATAISAIVLAVAGVLVLAGVVRSPGEAPLTRTS